VLCQNPAHSTGLAFRAR